MSAIEQPDARIILAGFMPGKIGRGILAALVLAVGGIVVVPYLLMMLDGYALDAEDARALRIVLMVTPVVAFAIGFRAEIAFDTLNRTITTAWSLFGLGPHHAYPLTAFHQVRLERCFPCRGGSGRIRFYVNLLGTTPNAKLLTINLGSFITMTNASKKAKQVSLLTGLPIDFINNATPAVALENFKRILTFPFRMNLAIARIGWWPLTSLLRNRRKNA